MSNNEHEDDGPLTPEAEKQLERFERRREQGLGYYAFEDDPERFVNITDPRSSYTKDDTEEVLQEVSSWFVKKDNKYHDVDNLQTRYSPHDIKQVVVQRVYSTFPKFKLGPQGWMDFFKVLLDPKVNDLNPETSIPVWSGKRVCIPTNRQTVIFQDGMAVVNIWHTPKYRVGKSTTDNSFWEFLEYVLPNQQDREIFTDWLAWSLQNEGKKPKWAVMLYSEKQGTGKSTLTDVMKALFGEENTGRTNGVGKLLGRFNKEVLENKLVIVEEVEVKRGSPQANSLKSLITEDSTMVEAKMMPAYVERIYCAFVMTTNHLPLWLEESDRRFFILNFDHDGYANGGHDYHTFTNVVERVYEQIATQEGTKGIYEALMARQVQKDVGLKLDVQQHSTDIMKRLKDLSPDVAKQIVEEVLEEKRIYFVPVELASRVINKFAPREANAQTHLFHEMGWKKKKFSWAGGTQKWVWYKEWNSENPPKRGWIRIGGFEEKMSQQVEKVFALLGRSEDVCSGGEVKFVETTKAPDDEGA